LEILIENSAMNNWKFSWLALAAFGAATAVRAAILTTVPMQGGMVMPMVSYQAADGRLHVMMPSEIPQLTPLLVSHPGDGFDPADPWFDALDPSRQGRSFSRRYGFVMDTMTDPLPANTQIWLRKVSGPPELKLHRYNSTAPKAFQPIFGADGVTNALYWNGMMFHPVASAPPGTNTFTAEFEAFLLDTTTGTEVPGSSSGLFTFQWTNLPDGRPTLRLSPGCLVAWPSGTPTNWVLEWAATPASPIWTPVTSAPSLFDGEQRIALPAHLAQQFFRMRFVP
jgi:hypothetical protein